MKHFQFSISDFLDARARVVRPRHSPFGVRCSMLLVLLLGVWGSEFGAPPVSAAQPTNAPARPSFSAFQIVAQHNIFNQRRSPAYTPSTERRQTLRPSRSEAFALVGTMNYGEGPMAFFEGSKSDYRKVLKPDEVIAGFKLVAIETSSVKLASPTNEVELQIGMQLGREEEGPWRVSARPESAEPSVPRTSTTRSSSQTSSERPRSEPSPPPNGDFLAGPPDVASFPLNFQGGAPFGPGEAEVAPDANNNRPAATSGSSDSDVLARLAARARAERGE